MGELQDSILCMIKLELTKMNLKIYQPDLINKMTQGFNEYKESLMTYNNTATSHTFCSIIKYLILKLLCTLACLYKGTPIQPLRIYFFGINFFLHPSSQLPFSLFARGQYNIARGKAFRFHEKSLITNLTTPQTLITTPSTDYPLPG